MTTSSLAHNVDGLSGSLKPADHQAILVIAITGPEDNWSGPCSVSCSMDKVSKDGHYTDERLAEEILLIESGFWMKVNLTSGIS